MTTDKQPALQPPERLLPCPLFGHLPSKDEWPTGPYISVSGEPGMPKFYAIVCPGCCSTSFDENKERVIKKWNTRARVRDGVVATVGLDLARADGYNDGFRQGKQSRAVAFDAYNQAIEDAQAAIRDASQGGGYWAAVYINAIARKCSPHVYVNRCATTAPIAAPKCDYCVAEYFEPAAPLPHDSGLWHRSRQGGGYYQCAAAPQDEQK